MNNYVSVLSGEDQEGVDALVIVANDSISKSAIRNRILSKISYLKNMRGHLPAKGILADIQTHSDVKIIGETGRLGTCNICGLAKVKSNPWKV
jgi:hypothetical protein